jgi:hypothetical protein
MILAVTIIPLAFAGLEFKEHRHEGNSRSFFW